VIGNDGNLSRNGFGNGAILHKRTMRRNSSTSRN
jgi:hypothetical protein